MAFEKIEAMCLAAFLLTLCSPAGADEWSTADRVREGAYLTLLAVDLIQTRQCQQHYPQCDEQNPMVGSHPGNARLNRIVGGVALLHVGIAAALPSAWRRRFQDVSIGIEVATVYHNYTVMVRGHF